MFAKFDRSGVAFAYPENWRLEEQEDDEASVNVTVSSPQTAFWTLVVYPDRRELAYLVEQAIEALRQEYPELEAAEVSQELGGVTLVGCDLSFFYLDLTSTVRLRACHRGGSTCLMLAQGEDRELRQGGAAVFDAITLSLLVGIPGASPA